MVTQIKEYNSAQAIAEALDKDFQKLKASWANTCVASTKSVI